MSEFTFPKRGVAYEFSVNLPSRSDPNTFQANPTLAAGDVKVSKDDGAENNITTLPTVSPSGSTNVKVSLSATETTADRVKVIFRDAAGDEWCDQAYELHPAKRAMEDLSYHDAAGVWSHATRTLSAFGFSVNLNADQSGVTVGTVNAVPATVATAANQSAMLTNQGTIAGYIDTEVAAIVTAIGALNDLSTTDVDARLAAYDAPTKAELDAAVATLATLANQTSIKGVTDKLNDTLEDDGGVSRFTLNALEQGPSGGAGLADAVWTNPQRTLTQPAAQVAEAVSGSRITIQRGDTVTIALTGLGSLAGRTELWFSVKSDRSVADSAADVKVSEGTGLEVIAGAAATASDGSIVVDDDAAGNITITLKAAATAQLTPTTGGWWHYDVQLNEATGARTVTSGRAKVEADVTRET